MNILHEIDQQKITRPIVTIGTFDGVHIGHKVLLSHLTDRARQLNGESLVLTFWPHPRFVLNPRTELNLLNTMDEKQELIGKYGIDNLLIIPFSKELAKKTAFDFIRDILIRKIGMRHLVVGHDHHFGKDREGDYANLLNWSDQLGFSLEKIEPYAINGENIGSTLIRNLLLNGSMEQANIYLGYLYGIQGRVEDGRKKGRTLGFPTANITLSNAYKVIPGNGVYAVRVVLKEGSYQGMINIGYRPTFNDDMRKKSLEVHIFDFSRDIYTEDIRVEFVKKIREEIKFDSIDNMVAQLNKDRIESKFFLK